MGSGSPLPSPSMHLAVVDAGEHAQRRGSACVPSLRASMKRVSPVAAAGTVRRALSDVPAGLVAGEEPEADGDAGGEEELRGQGDDASTRSASTILRRISPSPPVLDESEPLAMTKPATPPPRPLGGAR